MTYLRVSLFTVFGVIQFLKVLGAEVDVRVKPGDNVVLYCDCTWSSGLHTYWYRNCSHDGQPPLVILASTIFKGSGSPLQSWYESIWNSSRSSHDLLVKNITESQLGLYYCSVTSNDVIQNQVIQQIKKDTFGNITYKLSFEDPPPPVPEGAGQCWMLLAILCPVSALLAALISSACFYCCKTGPDQGQGDGFQVDPLLSKNYPRSLDHDFLTEVIYKQL